MKAMVVVNSGNALGDNSRRSMLAACERWDCDFIEMHQRSVLSPACRKTEVLQRFPGCEAVFILDADTVVSSQCPSPFDTFPKGKLTVVKNGNPLRFGDYDGIVHSERHEWAKVIAALPPAKNLPAHGDIPYFNTGMMTVWKSPVTEVIFEAAHNLCLRDLGLGWHDQTPLNITAAAFKDSNGAVNIEYVDETWNYIHPEHLPEWRVMKKFIYHFAGTPGRAELLESVKWELDK